jgi:hypothetical protein
MKGKSKLRLAFLRSQIEMRFLFSMASRVSHLIASGLFAIFGLFVSHVQAVDAVLTGSTIANPSKPNGVFYTANYLTVTSGYYSFLSFGFASLPPGVTGSQIQKATLRLYVKDVIKNGTFSIYTSPRSWSERKLTYKNAPIMGANLEAVGQPVSLANSEVTVDLTALTRDWIDGNEPNNGIIVSTTNAFFNFVGKQCLNYGVIPRLEITLASVGPQGAQGIQGPIGLTGPQGSQGPQGPAGSNGAVGPQGLMGIAGPQGAPGPVGAQGPAGSNGVNGNTLLTSGTNPVPYDGQIGDYLINTNSHTIFGPKSTNGWGVGVSIVGPQGQQGSAGTNGAVGPQGPQGLQGLKGDTGATGATGPQGPQGLKGDTGLTGPAGADGAVGPQGPQGVQGLKGDKGATGTAGPQGPAGPQGETGPAGPTGATGAAGPQGPQGIQGLTGLQGPAGPTGPQGPEGTNGINGTNGAGIISGAVAPSSTNYPLGSFYINTSSNSIYGPLTTNGWGSPISLVGDSGSKDEVVLFQPAPNVNIATERNIAGSPYTWTMAGEEVYLPNITTNILLKFSGSWYASQWDGGRRSFNLDFDIKIDNISVYKTNMIAYTYNSGPSSIEIETNLNLSTNNIVNGFHTLSVVATKRNYGSYNSGAFIESGNNYRLWLIQK